MAEIVETLIDARNALTAETAAVDDILFTGESQIETELNDYLQRPEFNSLEKIEKILRGDTGIDVIDGLALREIPRAHYYGVELPRIRTLTHSVTGCETEEELFDIIARETDENSSKIKKLFNNMSQWLKDNSSALIKNAILAGLGVGFLAYLKGIQKEETGCFRYDNKGRREKIPERSCNEPHDSGGGRRRIPHPLDGISWDCNYDITPLAPFDTGRVLKKGCKGICDPRAYNSLYKYAPPPHKWQACTRHDQYHYVCEKGTIMRALAREVGTTATEILKGFDDAHLFDSFKHVVLPILLIFLVIYINCAFVFSCTLFK